jgi:hypothetical protein
MGLCLLGVRLARIFPRIPTENNSSSKNIFVNNAHASTGVKWQLIMHKAGGLSLSKDEKSLLVPVKCFN